MQTIIVSMALGIAAGYLLRKSKLRYLGRVTMAIIWLLLFLLGIEAGGDDRIVRWIGTLGLEALAVSAAGVAGSSLLALLLWKWSVPKAAESIEKERRWP